jgi:hypothetical protein
MPRRKWRRLKPEVRMLRERGAEVAREEPEVEGCAEATEAREEAARAVRAGGCIRGRNVS